MMEQEVCAQKALGRKLVEAAGWGDIAQLKRLLKAKTLDVDYLSADGRTSATALQMACHEGHVGAVRLLLKAKASVAC